MNFPHLQPPSPLAAALEPEQAAIAAEALGAGTLIPIHYGGFEVDPFYLPVRRSDRALAGPRPRDRSYDVRILEPGESFEPVSATSAG